MSYKIGISVMQNEITCNIALISNFVKLYQMVFVGLRAEMGPGNSKMNDLTIIQTTQVS